MIYQRKEQIGDATLYLGDCLDVMPGLGKVDCVVTDPPYGIGDAPIKGQGRTGKRIGGENTWHPPSTWDKEFPTKALRLCCCVADVISWFGQWRKRGDAEAASAHPIRCEIVWAKDCHVGPPCPVAAQDERIWVFSRNGMVDRPFETSVWFTPIIPTWAHKEHKNEKPLALMRRLVRFATDGTVLDPFMGSGTTGVACANLGRRFIGIEIEPKYFDIACKRIEDAYKQPDLFIERPTKPVQEATAL